MSSHIVLHLSFSIYYWWWLVAWLVGWLLAIAYLVYIGIIDHTIKYWKPLLLLRGAASLFLVWPIGLVEAVRDEIEEHKVKKMTR